MCEREREREEIRRSGGVNEENMERKRKRGGRREMGKNIWAHRRISPT